jgi:2'-5' RNA ligase
VSRPRPGEHWLDRGPGRRLFIAVPLGEEARLAVDGLMRELGASGGVTGAGGGPRPRWVRSESLHLTIRFLGNTPPEAIGGLDEALDEAASGVEPIACRLAEGGAFPSGSRPRVLWIGVAEGASALANLARRVEDALAARGWERDERPFAAHLTLARTDGVGAAPALAAELRERAGTLDAAWTADRLVLFESITGNGPARYLPLHEAPLRG